MEHKEFVQRVLQRLPSGKPTAFSFQSWKHGGRPTAEGFGIMPIAGVDPDRIMAAVMALQDYVGNVEHVVESRVISDPRFDGVAAKRFYQKVNIPLLGAVQHELALHLLGEMKGYQVAAWDVLRGETDALNKKAGFRSDYNMGAWFAAPGVLGYALASAPKRDDVGWLKWKALTKGADAAASKVVKANLECMARWAARR